jgi:protease stability complex PrcB-like protein
MARTSTTTVAYFALTLTAATTVMGQQRAQPAPVAATEAVAVPLTRFRPSDEPFLQFSGLADSVRTAIRDETTWRSYWEAMHRPFIPAPPVPDIDFTREMVLLAALGTRPSGGFSLHIDGVVQFPSRLSVSVTRTVVGPGCVVAAVVTQPVDVVRVPVTSAPVVFAEQIVAADCRQ